MCKGSQMKAAQELLIFPFPNFFTFFIMWYLKEKNPSPTVIQKQIQTNHSKKKKKSMMWLRLFSYQWGWDLFRSIASPLSVFTLRWRVLSAICTPQRQEKIQLHAQEAICSNGQRKSASSPSPPFLLHCLCRCLSPPLLFLVKLL